MADMDHRLKECARTLARRTSIIDLLNLLFLALLVLFLAAGFKKTPFRWHLLLIYPILASLILCMGWLRESPRSKRFTPVLMIVYPAVFLFVVFETFFMLLPFINESRYDHVMTAIDFAVYGIHPTLWLESFASPLATEFMYLLYIFYFPMPLFILVWLFRRSKWIELERSMFIYLLTYYGAYVIYFFIPVEGPRFHLSHEVELVGLVLFEPIQRLIDFLEPNMLDCFPSLHAAITLTTLLIMGRHHKKMFYFFLPLGAGITLSLVYCRYHYVIDVAAGLIWAVACYILARRLYDSMMRRFARHFGCVAT